MSKRLAAEPGNEFLIDEDHAGEVKTDQVIKIPTENRSQYEKLSSTQEEFSSDDELGTGAVRRGGEPVEKDG